MKIKIIKTKAGHHVRLVARNGKILLSSEVYKTKQGAEKLANKLSIILIQAIRLFCTQKRPI